MQVFMDPWKFLTRFPIFLSWLAKLYGKEPDNPIPFKDLQQQSIHIVM